MNKKDYIHRSYSSLSPLEKEQMWREGILNGFGGVSQSRITRFFIGLVYRKFSIANSKIHDYWYWLWVTPRLECDQKFLQAMVEDMGDIYDRDKSALGLIWNLILCLLAYYSIRLFGSKYYWTP